MSTQTSWRYLGVGLGGVALVTTLLIPAPVGGWGGEPVPLAVPADAAEDSPLLGAIPRPPDPPALPADFTTTPPIATVEAEDRPAADDARSPTVEPGLVLDDPLFHDPRADVAVTLIPGIPVPTYPVVINAQVEALMDHFTARERERFGLWIARSGRYLGMIQRIFREQGLPQELAYTAMIESGFSSRAVSRVGAKGLWQFMEATARRYGLVVNRWVDERLDPVKATVAAAQYLGDLYGMFGHWFLAQAAYNAGEARIARAIQRARTSDFWALTQTRHLPNETKRFVPQILAATVITREPDRYGFDVAREAPLIYDEVTVKRPLDFETIAALAQVSVDEVRELNPALRGGVTPPFSSYALRLPVGSGVQFDAALQDDRTAKLVAWGLHRIARNQTLAGIARLYRTSPQRLAEVNQLAGGRLRGVSELLVPISNKLADAPKALAKPASMAPKIAGAARVAAGDGRSRARTR